ncbi:MAG: hypothetical protein JW861_09120 [Bacteroidales bacterium]|nr:hypothetical protein [Bacteroidales bacterium]
MKRNLLFIAGIMMIQVVMAQQVERDKVLLEIATGTWCPYCPGAAMGADDMVANGHDVAVIEYHYDDPYANAYASARISYYGVTGYPTAKFDGVLTKVGGSQTQSMYTQYLALYNIRKAIPSPFTLNIFGDHAGLDYSVMVVAEKLTVIH